MTASALPARDGRARWFADRPIAVKIGSAVAVLALVAIGMTVLAVARLGAVEAASIRINENVGTLADLADIQRSWQGDRSRYNSLALVDAGTQATVRADLAERRTVLEEQLDAYAEVTVNREAFDVFRSHVDEYYAVAEGQLVPAASAGDLAAAGGLITGPLQDSSDMIMDEYSAMQERRVAAGQADTDDATSIVDSARVTLWTALASASPWQAA
jgi:methyl-accepting chemotaxis protein